MTKMRKLTLATVQSIYATPPPSATLPSLVSSLIQKYLHKISILWDNKCWTRAMPSYRF